MRSVRNKGDLHITLHSIVFHPSLQWCVGKHHRGMYFVGRVNIFVIAVVYKPINGICKNKNASVRYREIVFIRTDTLMDVMKWWLYFAIWKRGNWLPWLILYFVPLNGVSHFLVWVPTRRTFFVEGIFLHPLFFRKEFWPPIFLLYYLHPLQKGK